jgi:hypothetical protein
MKKAGAVKLNQDANFAKCTDFLPLGAESTQTM